MASSSHGVVFREANRVWITDLGSANGTFVNGHKVPTDPIEIGSGDMLSFGPTTFAVRIF
jgi:pSer/pThr/pTyr-binding forkhead associated (FHA) protein